MPPTRYSGPPTTLGNMRANGVRSLYVSCSTCHHRAVLPVDDYHAGAVLPPEARLLEVRRDRRRRAAELERAAASGKHHRGTVEKVRMSAPDIDDTVKQSIWSLVQYLTARKAKKAAEADE